MVVVRTSREPAFGLRCAAKADAIARSPRRRRKVAPRDQTLLESRGKCVDDVDTNDQFSHAYELY